MISAYAPTEEASDEEKSYFTKNYECNKIPKRDMLLLLEGFNANILKEEFMQRIAGKHAVDNYTNKNGRYFAQLPVEEMLVSTYFRHTNMLKGT